MSLWFRTWRRTRLVARHEREYGNLYEFHGIQVEIPKEISVDLKNALIKNKYESQERNFIKAYLPQDCDVIELGGSIGVVSAYTRSRIGPDARQIVVEALADLAEICRANIAKQDPDSRSTVVQAAISYSAAKTIRFMVGDNPHVGRIGDGEGTAVDVPVIQLEDLCREHKIDQFALICDIEGGEVELFDQSSIWKTACPLIILETHPNFYDEGGKTQDELVSKIKAAGFEQLGEDRGVYAFGRQIS